GRPRPEGETVRRGEARKPVGALEKLVAEAGLQLLMRGEVRDPREGETPRVVAADDERERVLESERRAPHEVPPLRVLLRDARADAARIGDRLLLQDRRVCRSRVLGIEVELARDEAAMAQEAAAEIELPLDPDARSLERLRGDLSQDDLLGEVLRADAHGPAALGAAGRKGETESGGGSDDDEASHRRGLRRLSARPRRRSRTSASAAAG